jgi:hypothetical protein
MKSSHGVVDLDEHIPGSQVRACEEFGNRLHFSSRETHSAEVIDDFTFGPIPRPFLDFWTDK